MADDSADLAIEVAWLSGAVIVVRRESANRLAAIRAPLRAAAEGEVDPLGLLRDELAESLDAQIPGQGRGCCRWGAMTVTGPPGVRVGRGVGARRGMRWWF
jgi:hypothetical protein